MTRVAFLGAGIMGREMVRKLLAAGHQVRVYNRTLTAAEPLAAAGAELAETPAAAAEGAEMVISMVSDDEASRAVWLGPGGVLAGDPMAGAIAVESSTLSRGWVIELAAALNKAGLRYLDCPVSGGPDGVLAGSLTLLVGGDKECLAAAGGTLSAYSNRVIHFGPVGAGTAYKLVVNLMGAVQGVALAEGWALARRAGLDPAKVAEALSSGAVASPHVKYLTERMLSGNHDEVYFSTSLRHKDAAYGLRLGKEMGQAMPASETATETYRRAVERGLGEKNSSVIVEILD
ncbi:MAG: NAD(P)-dependent oxidoreductase [Rhodospirillales bacterium]|jgi:3-hydroxyisobutyrate dehydrogenase|nr:dehydrogenase [Rhodospirillaceae bacterium]MDP6427611.1 NAD(P)-dependent oxidoreductase [Rhodospirillales bacterium]MDP6645934.1 NAD(P)-dependent oxidoreductase [Rhodospirillales bacterium]MDP6841565.1 NAD(P)-dependent oxidoreductase [Rhodospirillales bacterium]